MSAMQRLANINVAKPGDDALIEQRRFQACLLAATGARQHRGVEGIAKRLRTKAAQQRLMIELYPRHQFHRTEATWIVERHACARRQMEHHVIVGEVLAALVVVAAEVIVLMLVAAEKNVKRSRHAE